MSDFRTHQSYPERIHDNLEEKIVSIVSGILPVPNYYYAWEDPVVNFVFTSISPPLIVGPIFFPSGTFHNSGNVSPPGVSISPSWTIDVAGLYEIEFVATTVHVCQSIIGASTLSETAGVNIRPQVNGATPIGVMSRSATELSPFKILLDTSLPGAPGRITSHHTHTMKFVYLFTAGDTLAIEIAPSLSISSRTEVNSRWIKIVKVD